MRKILTVLTAATAMTLVAAMAVPQAAEARYRGHWAGAVLGGLAAGAIIGGLAAQGGYYGYYGPGYYGYAPGYSYSPATSTVGATITGRRLMPTNPRRSTWCRAPATTAGRAPATPATVTAATTTAPSAILARPLT